MASFAAADEELPTFDQIVIGENADLTAKIHFAYNIICAGVLLTLIPSLIIFLIFQKQVYAGLASGSVKG